MVIRPLREQDREHWIQLRKALWPGESLEDLDVPEENVEQHCTKEPVYVCEDEDGSLCGMIELSIRPHAEGCKTRRVGYIEGWYVVPQYRNRGIGRLLVQAAENWAREQGCVEMGSDTTPDYPISPIAHKALGYEEVQRTIHYRKAL